MNIYEIIVCMIVAPLAIWGLYNQAKMVDEVKRDERKRGMR